MPRAVATVPGRLSSSLGGGSDIEITEEMLDTLAGEMLAERYRHEQPPPPSRPELPDRLAQKVRRRAVEHEALTLSLRGYSVHEIAAWQACSIKTVQRRVDRALRRYVPDQEVAEARRQQVATAQLLLGRAVRAATDDSRGFEAAPHTAAARHLARLAALLGTDQPHRVELSHDGVAIDAEIESLIARLTRPVSPPPEGTRPPPPMPVDAVLTDDPEPEPVQPERNGKRGGMASLA